VKKRILNASVALVAATVLLASCSSASASATPGCNEGKQNQMQGGLVTVDLTCGTGPGIKTGQVAFVSYTGKLADGKVFDSTDKHGGQPFPVQLGAGKVIQGWELGIPGMGVGGTRKLVIPPGLAYGQQGYPGVIPKNATLTFLVTLKKIKG
jgi:FKBP-type peptidyl-prolyl cis-trans isomerase